MVVRERHLHEVTLHEADHVAAALLLAKDVAAVDLELVQSERGHVRRREAVDVPGRTANSAAAVENLGALVDPKLASKVVLVAKDRLAEGFVAETGGEVERGAPAPLVELGGKVIVRVHQRGVVSIAALRALSLLQIVVLADPVVLLGRGERREEDHRLFHAQVHRLGQSDGAESDADSRGIRFRKRVHRSQQRGHRGIQNVTDCAPKRTA
mmetsp:Transcript_35474/g.61305  ORF Transcript_35474/g.61305 Transcript_35474/m.61305 type:complete len:211 (-) Transcript_35474:72-704(-)